MMGAAALLAGAPTPAQAAANGITYFQVPYGNTVTQGTVTWYNQSFYVEGDNKTTAGNCRDTQVTAYLNDGRQVGQTPDEGHVCDREASHWNHFGETVNTNIPGVANYLIVCLKGNPMGSGSAVNLACKRYNRPY
jgi:hypothetical protein